MAQGLLIKVVPSGLNSTSCGKSGPYANWHQQTKNWGLKTGLETIPGKTKLCCRMKSSSTHLSSLIIIPKGQSVTDKPCFEPLLSFLAANAMTMLPSVVAMVQIRGTASESLARQRLQLHGQAVDAHVLAFTSAK